MTAAPLSAPACLLPPPRMDEILPGLAAAPNVHPLFVHFPIVLWWTALAFWVVGLIARSTRLFAAGRWLFCIGLAFGVVAILTGLSAEETQDVSAVHEMVEHHKVMMLVSAGLAVLTLILSLTFRRLQRTWMRAVETLLLLATVVVMTLGADHGALLAFGHGVGTRPYAQELPADGGERGR